MAEEPHEVIIDGVRYVPARDLQPAVDDFRNALLDVWWGYGYRVSGDPEEGLFIDVNDNGQGEPFTKFMDDVIAKLARTKRA
jgi:hypothetical protein